MKNNQMMFAWHYTTGEKFIQICASGLLMPATAGVTPPEKPVLWFSTAPYWEPTACKAVMHPDGRISRLTMGETKRLARGLVRFCCPVSKLTSGEALRRKARMKSSVWADLCAEGRRQGARPDNWWGRTTSLPLDGLAVDVMNDDLQWEAVRKPV